jgi:hypothetical protein
MHRRSIVLGVLVVGAACGPAPANFSGAYTGMATNGINTCPMPWVTGSTQMAGLEVQQSGADVSAQVTGGAGVFLSLWLGSDRFQGVASGSQLQSTLIGNVMHMRGQCAYRIRGDFSAAINGNTLEGRIVFRPDNLNGNPDCAAMTVTGCSFEVTYSATRPGPGPGP